MNSYDEYIRNMQDYIAEEIEKAYQEGFDLGKASLLPSKPKPPEEAEEPQDPDQMEYEILPPSGDYDSYYIIRSHFGPYLVSELPGMFIKGRLFVGFRHDGIRPYFIHADKPATHAVFRRLPDTETRNAQSPYIDKIKRRIETN